jgi:hypothetical protein
MQDHDRSHLHLGRWPAGDQGLTERVSPNPDERLRNADAAALLLGAAVWLGEVEATDEAHRDRSEVIFCRLPVGEAAHVF